MRRFTQFSAAVFLALLFLAQPVTASSVTLNYQGLLTDPAGTPVPNSTYQVLFRIMDDPVVGNELWRELHPALATTNGLFSVALGSVSPLDQSVFNTQPLWLEIQVGADPPLSPRTRLRPVPTATAALQLNGTVKTAPGIIRVVPPDPFLPNDTGPHIELIADSQLTKLKLHPPDPFDPPGDGGVEIGVFEGSNSFFDIMYQARATDSGTGVKMLVDSTTAKIFLQHHQDSSSINLSVSQLPMMKLQDPVSNSAVNLGIDPSEGGIIVVDSRPSDGLHSSEVAIASGVSSGASLKMFNPQPEPPGQPAVEILSGDGGGPGINLFSPKVGAFARGAATLSDTLVQISADSVTGGRIVIRNTVTGQSSVYTSASLSFNSSAGGSSAMINSSGDSYLTNSNLGLGTNTPGNILTVAQSSATDPIADAWTTYSSRRWKTNIKTIDEALDKVERLRGVYFDWKADGKHDVGLIAEEVGEVIPEVVTYEENGVDAKSVDYARLVAVLIEAVKQQQRTISGLQKKAAQVETLQTKVDELGALVRTALTQQTGPREFTANHK